jgi:hypothetical protein
VGSSPIPTCAYMAELVDALDSKSNVFNKHEGSSPSIGKRRSINGIAFVLGTEDCGFESCRLDKNKSYIILIFGIFIRKIAFLFFNLTKQNSVNFLFSKC